MAFFVSQTYPPLVLDTEYDLTTASEVKIAYTKPSGATGMWTGIVSGTTKITRNWGLGDLSEAGNWELQAYAVFPGDNYAYGDKVNLEVSEPILTTNADPKA